MNKQLLFLCALLAAAALVFPSISRADGLTLTIDTTNLTVNEGNTLNVQFTFTNNSGADVTTENAVGGGAAFAGTGDPTDSFANSVIDLDHCRFMTLAAGSSCLFSIDYITDSDTGESDGDSGLNESAICMEVVGQPDVCTDAYFMTVNDPPVAAPEPSSFILLGTGFLGVLGGVRRRGLLRSES